MPTLLAFHEVDDVERWLGSPRREEVFGPLGITFAPSSARLKPGRADRDRARKPAPRTKREMNCNGWHEPERRRRDWTKTLPKDRATRTRRIPRWQIGRASCRERELNLADAV